MHNTYEINGVITWDADEIDYRDYIVQYMSSYIADHLRNQNNAWRLLRIEGPILTPRDCMSNAYSEDDYFSVNSILALRPETTKSSYVYANKLLQTHSGFKLPLCIWQAGKSFRQEQDQTTKHMRLKEFYQQEFQCIYSANTMNDYHQNCLEPMRLMIEGLAKRETRLIESDRRPAYSLRTMDIEINIDGYWMEVCSISKRTDFAPGVNCLEIAIGLDRLVYSNFGTRG